MGFFDRLLAFFGLGASVAAETPSQPKPDPAGGPAPATPPPAAPADAPAEDDAPGAKTRDIAFKRELGSGKPADIAAPFRGFLPNK